MLASLLLSIRSRLPSPCPGVEVQTDSHCFTADAVVVTVPLGVLKAADGLRFAPPLPARKRGAIKRIGFGCMNKVGSWAEKANVWEGVGSAQSRLPALVASVW